MYAQKRKWPRGGETPWPRRGGELQRRRDTRSARFSQTLRVELVGDDQAIGPWGLAVTAYEPFCALCRLLIRAGVDPDTPVGAYRGGILSLRARWLAAAARLTVEDVPDGRPRFR